ncbi:MFS general substrate transporter [Aulographum hederae CBS 113979]|uniref:MFS general substrate transporter n=1 Tax=Aulographum hederae CBS 113979 TaxID=1176131 RepID=A0A6G1HH76_9PEZI|nr:MFS general substrate transporter [Aulographum hederae CBS 113979]
MAEKDHQTARLVAVIAATTISLACGTNYGYSAWGPQFADRLRLSTTASNIIGASGNLGMYASGIPLGWLVDKKSPRLAILIGGAALGLGYFPIKMAYDKGEGSMSVASLCFFAFLTGMGSCSAFSASIKVAALNWPYHRGTATAFPLAAFGLSALFFTLAGHIIYTDDTSGLLLLLSLGTFALVFISFFFVRVPHPSTYTALATTELHRSPSLSANSNRLHRTKSGQSKYSTDSLDAGPTADLDHLDHEAHESPDYDATEDSSLMSSPSDQDPEDAVKHRRHTHSHRPDLSGWALVRRPEFWLLFCQLGLLTGVGLMTINNIGNDAQALWYHLDPSTPKPFLLRRQLLHVSTISFCSFSGRLLSGIGSDFLIKRLHASRFWCIVASSSIFTLAQLAALLVSTPQLLFLVSALTGLAYGALFGVYPALVADAFGVHGLSMNWGTMTVSPVLSGPLFNAVYGAIFDSHSKTLESGVMVCEEGLQCYRSAYYMTLGASLVGVGIALWAVNWDHRRKAEEEREMRREA